MRADKLERSAGVLTPLFSVHSKNSIGVGELPDLRLLVDWAVKCGLKLVQLLPMNDAGFNFRPYDSESSIALEPMYLSLTGVRGVDQKEFAKEIDELRRQFPCEGDFFDTRIKKAKLDILWYMFRRRQKSSEAEFNRYVSDQASWLGPYAEYRVLKDRLSLSAWMDWPEEYRERRPEALEALAAEEKESLVFYQWVQWQLFLQLSAAHEYAAKKGVRIIGDIPFLVSRDSADVWSNRPYFKLGLSSGAPPDLYFAGGQEWGMPPCDWEEVRKHDYDYIARKLKYAENFYDLYRIDHFVGVFRVWTFRRDAPDAERAKTGAFDPPDESVWEEHGRRIIEAMLGATRMRPCAEDLGCVPKFSEKVLDDYGIPGMDVQRWMRHWETTQEYKGPDEYRENGMAVISTHDTAPLAQWWKWEAGDEDDRQKFWESVGLEGTFEPEPSPKFAGACLRTVMSARSRLSVQLLQDWLYWGGVFKEVRKDYRINKPGMVIDTNWRMRLPLSLEAMMKLPLNRKIAELSRTFSR